MTTPILPFKSKALGGERSNMTIEKIPFSKTILTGKKYEDSLKKKLDDVLYHTEEDGRKFGINKLQVETLLNRRAEAVEKIYDMMVGSWNSAIAKALQQTRSQRRLLSDLGESKNPRDIHHFIDGWKYAREVLSNVIFPRKKKSTLSQPEREGGKND